MTIDVQILSKEKLHDATIYAAYMQLKKNGKYQWRIISAELFVEIYTAGSFVKDPHASAGHELYHTAF